MYSAEYKQGLVGNDSTINPSTFCAAVSTVEAEVGRLEARPDRLAMSERTTACAFSRAVHVITHLVSKSLTITPVLWNMLLSSRPTEAPDRGPNDGRTFCTRSNRMHVPKILATTAELYWG